MKKNENSVFFMLHNILTRQFAIIEEAFDPEKDVELGTNIGYGLIKDKHIILVLFKITFSNNSVPFLKLELECGFEIKNESFEDFVDHDKNEIKIPCSLLKHLAVITIGTARGVIHAKTEGTDFNKIFLPTINVNEQIKEDVVFPIDN